MNRRYVPMVLFVAGGILICWVMMAEAAIKTASRIGPDVSLQFLGSEPITETTKLVAPDGEAMDQFGASLALDGEQLAVGATDDDDQGLSSGSVYVFEHSIISDTWNVLKLVAFDGVPLAHFGASVALDEGALAVGAPGDNDERGAVYIFEQALSGNGTWQFLKKITMKEGEAGDNFGNAVALSGGTLAVGVRGDDDLGFEAGAVYIYERDQGGTGNWGFVKTIYSSGTSLADYFGTSVSLDGDSLVVGALGDDVPGGLGAGTVTVFEQDQGGTNNWGEVKILKTADASPNDMLGASVVIQGDTIIAGAIGVDAGVTDSGAAYVFERNLGGEENWGERAKLVASDATTFQSLGQAVALEGDLSAVGAPENNLTQPGPGAVYLFARNHGGLDAWGQYQKLLASDGEVADAFGYALQMALGRIVVGAKLADTTGDEAGAGYIFEGGFPPTLTPTPTWTPTLTPTPTPSSTASPTQTLTPTPTPEINYLIFVPLVHR